MCVGGGAVRWRKCLELVSLCKAPLEQHLQEDCLDRFTAPSQEKHLSMEGEQKSSTAGKGAEDLGEILQIIWRGATLICMKCFAVNF